LFIMHMFIVLIFPHVSGFRHLPPMFKKGRKLSQNYSLKTNPNGL